MWTTSTLVMKQTIVIAALVVGVCLCPAVLAAGETEDAATCTPPSASSAPTSPTRPTTTPAWTAPPRRTAPGAIKTLSGVRPMRDRSNSTEPIPCTCGIFLSSQCGGGGQPTGLPAISHEFKRATPNTAAGVRQCTTACVDMIVKHLPNSAAILCSSIERDCMREKAFLFIKNVRNKWLTTRLSAGREFCCKGGTAVKCPPK